MKFFPAVLICLSALVISGCGGGRGSVGTSVPVASNPVETIPQVRRVEAYQPPAAVRLKSVEAPARGERPAAAVVRLPPLPAVRRANAISPPPGVFGVPVQIGSAREVTATVDAGAMRRMLRWQRGANVAAAAVSFTSEGAAGLRIGLLVRRLPADAVVRGYVQGSDTAFEIPGSTILAAIARNRDAGDVSDAARTYWTPPVDGEELTLEIALPSGIDTDVLDVSVPQLSHLYFTSDDLLTAKIGQAQSCEVDVSCVSDADNLSRATARMLFTQSGVSYLCTGTLLNDSSSSATPYFLSANHCISAQTVASSLTTFWFWRSSSCNSGILNSGSRSISSGATLLYANSASDTSFMRLNDSPPTGATYAGWTVDPASVGEDVVGIHHPLGDLQKYNQGSVSGFGSCSPGSIADTFSCSLADQSSGGFLFSTWNVGTTEAGSSGSGLFAAVGGSRYLVGQLYGGNASCNVRGGSDWYGRFDTAYFAALGRWLGASAPAVVPRTAIYRFYNAGTGAHFFTANPLERDWVIASNAAFRFEGVAFYGYGSQISGSSPVYRFYNTRTGRHFFTIGTAERDIVLATNPDFSFEGISWYAQAEAGGSGVAVYRFYNAGLATHFYTISEAERDWVQTNPSYRLEGVAFYAWTTQ